ncbi:MAG TPA: tRNA (guanosine(46)-N7)-methyltransferase TrmB [Puia sp.]|nr:tRNA (guanosine(46)-N7)-methyltransferase TrmB [Puia sp.]
MGQKKLLRFEAINGFQNVFQYPEDMKGKWNAFFKNQNPIVLELACGKGEYALGLAEMYPQKNFIGVDLKGNRMYVGAKKCLEENILNVAFLRTHIDKINNYFAKGEVEEIWLIFPDPQLRRSKNKKRLTHPAFLRLYQQILVDAGTIHLKTDSPDLFEFTKMIIDMYGLHLFESADNVYEQPKIKAELKIKTYYESLDIAGSRRIHYLKFSLPVNELPQIDDELHKKIMQHGTAI